MNWHNIVRVHLTIVAITFGLLGVSIMLIGHHAHIQSVTDFFLLSDLLSPNIATQLTYAAMLAISVWALVLFISGASPTHLGIALIALSTIPLLTLLSSSRWIESLGGFPAIGSGQGIIKYFALMVMGIALLRPNWLTPEKGKFLCVFPVVLVLLWIGGMKFTLLEAQGIEPLVRSSPLMSWMYNVWDLQTTSNLIGVYDLTAVLLLLAAMRYPVLLLPSIVLSGVVFLMTQSFLFSWDAALSSEHLLSTGGHFLIKDLWFIANLSAFYTFCRNDK